MTNVKDYRNIAMHLSNRFETHVEFNVKPIGSTSQPKR